MHKHHMTFKDFNDNDREIDLYFNLTEAEVTKMQIESNFGLQHDLEEATKNQDNKKLLEFMEYLVHHAYGIKSADGMEFEKSPEIMRRFENSAYYSDLYMSLFQEEGAVGARFINALLPADLIRRAEANARGEGELAQKAAAATAFKPDARSIFEESRAGLQDHKKSATVVVQESHFPTSDPKADQDYQDYLAWKNRQINTPPQPGEQLDQSAPSQFVPTVKEETETPKDPNAPLTRAEYAEQIAATQQIPEGLGGLIARPPHESGPGFEVTPDQQ